MKPRYRVLSWTQLLGLGMVCAAMIIFILGIFGMYTLHLGIERAVKFCEDKGMRYLEHGNNGDKFTCYTINGVYATYEFAWSDASKKYPQVWVWEKLEAVS